MSFVALDLGASSTRYVSNSGKFSTLPNNVVFVEKEDENGIKVANFDPIDIEVTGGDITDALEVIIQHPDDHSGYFPMHAVMGSLADSYSPNNEYPSILMRKCEQRINYLSSIVAIAVSKLQHNLDDKINVYIALPPSEVKESKDIVKNNLIGHYDVNFVKYNGGVTVSFDIVNIKCAEESYMAATSYFFDINGTIRDKARPYLTGIVLSLDIGASTTDIAIVKNGRYLDKSGRTYRTGGNVARDALIEYVLSTEGYTLPTEEANITMAEGRLKFGNKYKDVSGVINEAKEKVAVSLVNSINNYFASRDIPLQTINAIIVSGGGSMSSQYINSDSEVVVTSKPMSEFITNALKNICDGIVVESHGDNPRMANINGLFIRAHFDAVAAAK